MFNSIRKLFSRRGGATAQTIDGPDHAEVFAPPVVPSSRAVRVDAQPAPAARGAAAPSNIGVPLKSIIGRLPADLMQRVRQIDVGEAEIQVPTQKVLSQISTGAVKISFGELRQLAPAGTFTAENDRDRTPVELPLYEILSRLNPGLLMRRPAQRHVDVPAEVVGPFGGQSKVRISSTPVTAPPPGKPAAPTPAPAPMPTVRAQPSVPLPSRAQPAVISPMPQTAAPSAPAVPRGIPGPSAPKPVFARIRPGTTPTLPAAAKPVAPISPIAPAAPAEPVAPAVPVEEPESIESDMPVFNRINPAPVAPPSMPPVVTPIAPDPAPKPSGDTDIIQMPDNFRSVTPAAPITPIAPEPVAEPEPIKFSAPVQRSVAPAPAVPVSSGETRFITVAVAELVGSWPEAVRNEINAQNLTGSWIGLPMGAVEGVIKTGKISFPWKALRSWIKPPIPATPSPYDTTMLELPLKVITPLFLAELKSTRAQKKLAVDEGIPDLFFNSQPPVDASHLPVAPATPVQAAPMAPRSLPLPAPAPAPAPVPQLPISNPAPAFPASAESARPSDTNYFVWKEGAAEDQVEPREMFVKKGTNTPSTAFLNRYATPNEIVSRTAGLDGVDGALIALPDGLLVASKIPSNMNADTIAAFLPQIFGRVSQCTRELRLGELNNLNFTVGNIPWKIFRVGSIYFAAFGRPGVPLPTAQLVGLAAELDRKAK